MKHFRSVLFRGCFSSAALVAPVALVALFYVPLTVTGQTTTGRILGSVHDAQDAAIVGARVTVTDTQRNTLRSTVSDEAGEFVVPDLQPSTYKVQIEAKGFRNSCHSKEGR